LYQAAPSLHQQGTHLISCDEMTAIQALERARPTLPMRPGRVEGQEFEYIRHGTQSLIANLEVATGQIVVPSLGATRTEADFVTHIQQTIATDPDAGWIFVTDQLNIHQSASLVSLVAKHCLIQIDLGVKRKVGILKSMQTRAAFLSNPAHRIRFVYVPQHTSWLNQIEIWFSILARRLLKRANFTSVDDLRQHIFSFIEYFNRTMAKPFNWKYTGKKYPV
jgi:transposase